jgi:hypothetical protein
MMPMEMELELEGSQEVAAQPASELRLQAPASGLAASDPIRNLFAR